MPEGIKFTLTSLCATEVPQSNTTFLRCIHNRDECPTDLTTTIKTNEGSKY